MNRNPELANYFNGKCAVVTGAASGVGLALTEQLLASDAALVVMADFNPDHLRREGERLAALYPEKILPVLCNVTREDEVKKMIADAVARGGRFDLLINNAGAAFTGAFDSLSDEDWHAAFELNFYGALYGVRAAVPYMRKSGGGQIVNIISGIAFCPMPMQSRYSATKAALNALSLSLRAEYEIENIKISAATPGSVRTPIWGESGAPETAQTPAEAACRILLGAVHNERIITGDEIDRICAQRCFNPDCAAGYDDYLREVARKRRAGFLNAF